MLPSPNNYLYTKTQRYPLVLSSDITNQRTLQSEWTSDTIGYTQPKVVASGAKLSLDD